MWNDEIVRRPLMILVAMMVDFAVHGGRVRPRDSGGFLVLGRGGGLCLLAGTERERGEQPIELVAAAGGAGGRRIPVAGGPNQYLELVCARLASVIKQGHDVLPIALYRGTIRPCEKPF